METEKRRQELMLLFRETDRPLTGGELARKFGVSRQVIVQDIAILRAAGEQVLATPQGYLIQVPQQENQVRRIVASRHTREQIEDEIGLVVDLGGKVLDVFVEHPLYGELRGSLMISSRRDLNIYLKQLFKSGASPLLALTGGIHLHTLEAPEEKIMDEIIAGLDRAGYLVR